jgi:hypothetical protein
MDPSKSKKLHSISEHDEFYGESLTTCPNPRLENDPFSAVLDCLLNIFTPAVSFIHNPRTCHGIVTGSDCSEYTWVVELILLDDLRVSPQDMMKLVTNHQRWWEVTSLSPFLYPFCTPIFFPSIRLTGFLCHLFINTFVIPVLFLHMKSVFLPSFFQSFIPFISSPSSFCLYPFSVFYCLCVSLFLSQFLSNSPFTTICYCL